MSPKQSAMGRAALGWSRADLAAAAGLSVPTAVRFERGQGVNAESVTAMQRAMEAKGVRFVTQAGAEGALHKGA